MSNTSKLTWIVLLLVAIVAGAIVQLHGHNFAVLNPQGVIASRERHLMIVASSMTLIVLVPVFGLLAYIAWHYREANTHAKYQPNWDGNRAIETTWWLIPSVLIVILGGIIWNSSHELDPFRPIDSKVQPLTIQVVALDWKWLFIYPQQGVASVNYVQFPVNTPVNFEITADAPMNSFWIPQLGGQIYAMPGMSTELHLMAGKDGNYRGSSANLSGQGFAGMDFTAHASSQNGFDAWVSAAGQSSNKLTQKAYDKLAQPGENRGVAYYSGADANLYTAIITKYMGPMTHMEGM